MATHIKANGREKIVTPKSGKRFTLEEIQEYVGGYFEQIVLERSAYMLVNEDARLLNLPKNKKADRIAVAARIFAAIRGDVLVVSAWEME